MRNMEVMRPGAANALRAPDYVDARVLAANTAESHTVPVDARYVVLAATDDFWVNYATTAVIPAADITDGSAPEFNPVCRYLGSGVASISIIAPRPCVVTLAFYAE